MELVLVLAILVVLALAATGVAVSKSRRSQRAMDAAERSAITQTRPQPPPRQETGPADVEIVLPPGDDIVVPPEVEDAPVIEEPLVRPRLRDRLGKARALLSGYFGDLRGRTVIDDEVWEELEEALIRADVGVAVTGRILELR